MSAWLHLTAGRGPEECALAVRLLAEAALRELGPSAQLLEAEPGPRSGTLLSALIAAEADALDAAGWRDGTALWICPSPFRSHHKRKNWFVGVAVLRPPDVGAATLDPRDVVFVAMRASGPGGQHVNTTDSAVRAVHKPTGLAVVAREERSQHANRRLALAKLAAKLAERADAVQADAAASRRASHDALERGRPFRSYVGPGFRRADRA